VSMWNDHWSIMKPAYFIIWFSFNINFRFSIKWCSGPKKLYSANMWSTPAVWKQYNKMAVLHFILVNSTLIYILFSLPRGKVFGPFTNKFLGKQLWFNVDGKKYKKCSNISFFWFDHRLTSSWIVQIRYYWV